jgi:hypothetical protein
MGKVINIAVISYNYFFVSKVSTASVMNYRPLLLLQCKVKKVNFVRSTTYFVHSKSEVLNKIIDTLEFITVVNKFDIQKEFDL